MLLKCEKNGMHFFFTLGGIWTTHLAENHARTLVLTPHTQTRTRTHVHTLRGAALYALRKHTDQTWKHYWTLTTLDQSYLSVVLTPGKFLHGSRQTEQSSGSLPLLRHTWARQSWQKVWPQCKLTGSTSTSLQTEQVTSWGGTSSITRLIWLAEDSSLLSTVSPAGPGRKDSSYTHFLVDIFNPRPFN